MEWRSRSRSVVKTLVRSVADSPVAAAAPPAVAEALLDRLPVAASILAAVEDLLVAAVVQVPPRSPDLAKAPSIHRFPNVVPFF